MGLLDDLRQQSASLQEKDKMLEERRQQAEHVYQTKTVPALNTIYNTLNEIAKHLNYIKPDIPVAYQFDVDGLQVELKQGEHKALIDSTKNTSKVSFLCRCEHFKDIAFKVGGATKVEENLQYLKKSKVVFQFRPEKNDYHEITGAHFAVKPSIPVSMTFVPDIENRTIKVTFQNFGDLSVRSYNLQPDRVNEEFLDRLGRFIVREVDDLFDEKVDDDVKEKLRAQIEAEKQQRLEELKAAEEERLAEEQRTKEESKLGVLNKKKEAFWQKLKSKAAK